MKKLKFWNKLRKIFPMICTNAKSQWKTKTINSKESTLNSEPKTLIYSKVWDPVLAQILSPKSENSSKKTKTWTDSSCRPKADSTNKSNSTNKRSTTSANKSATSTANYKNNETTHPTTYENWPKSSQSYQSLPTKKSANKIKSSACKNYWTKRPTQTSSNGTGR